MTRTDTPPVPPTTQDVSINHLDPAPNQPNVAVTQVPGGFAKEGPQDNRNDATWSQSDVNIKGTAPAVQDIQSQLATLLGPDVLAQIVDQALTKRLTDMGIGAQSVSERAPEAGAVNEPTFKFLKHYRNDVSPEIRIQELDMSADNPQLAPIPGANMKFRRGHFYAQTENQVAQLDWMMANATHTGDTSGVIGGNRSIYVDDGEVLYYCTAGCDRATFHSASKDRYKAHMLGVHGMNV